jgi:protein tyrosine phosphatase (PTP) superfamily phosphohydrolase (DUF442 family)
MKNIQTKYKLNFKTMKKGLLTLLAASLVFVGCQNYDDQFDDLNAQISALKSQVDGLSSLSGQVSSLSGSIAGLQAGVSAAQAAANAASSAATAAGASADAATAAVAAIPATDLSGLEASLATLAAEVDAVQASLATAATASDIATLQAELDAIEADVDELLATSNVYTKDLTITSAATLDAAVALGNNINIVNGTVTISQTAAMDATKLQSVIDKIFTVTGNYTYSAAATSVTPMTFDKLASATDITLTVNGPISAKALVSAGTVTLNTTYTSKVTGVDFGLLTSVTNLKTGSTNDAISFTSATNVDLGSLANYPGYGSDYGLTITTKKGATVDIASLDDVSATGTATDVALTINGAKDVNISNITSYSGSLTVKNVENLTTDGFKGIITLQSGVENVTIKDAEQLVFSTTSAPVDLESVVIDVDKASDPDLSATVKAAAAYGGSITAYTGETPSLSFSSMPDLVSITLTGYFLDIDILSLSDLTTVDIEATIRDLDIYNNDNLTSVDVTGSTIRDITRVSGNDALTTLELDHTTGLAQVGGSTGTASKNASLTVGSNAELTSLTVGANKFRTVSVTGNTKLTTVDFTAWTSLGTAASSTDYPVVDIYSNGLVATKAQDTDDGTTQYSIDGTNDASDKGTYTTASGMETLVDALTALKAVAEADVAVHFDTVSIHTIDTDATYGSESSGEQNSGNALTYADDGGEKTNWVGAVYYNTKSTEVTTSTGYSAVAAKRAYGLTEANNMVVELESAGLHILNTGSTYEAVTLTGNKAIDVPALKTSLATSRATALGVTLDVTSNFAPTTQAIRFLAGVSSASNGSGYLQNGEKWTTNEIATKLGLVASYTAYHPTLLTTWDKFTVTYGDGVSVVTTLTSDEIGAAGFLSGITAVTTLVTQLVADWSAKYSTGSASAAYSFWTTPTVSSVTMVAPSLKSSLSGSRAVGDVVAVTWNAPNATQVSNATNGQATFTMIDWVIGATPATTDNAAVGNDYLITIAEATAGSGVLANTTLTIDGIAVTWTGFSDVSTHTAAGILSTTLISYGTSASSTSTASTIYWADARGDVVNGQAAFEGISSTSGTARATRSRIHWLSS